MSGRSTGRAAVIGALVITAASVGCAADDRLPDSPLGPDAAAPGAPEWLIMRSGGLTTTTEAGDRSFSLSARNLSASDRTRFGDGDELFALNFSTNDGLGPDFNATACTSCHVDNGRFEGTLDDGVLDVEGPVVHISAPGADPLDPPSSLPGYGTRIQTAALAGEPEAVVWIEWEWIDGDYPDGTSYELRRPIVTLAGSRGAIAADAEISLRIPPHVAGAGLLQAISAADVLALADPDDADGDGISGRPNWVPTDEGSMALGRFGWKAEQADLLHQSATALAEDIGIATSLHPGQSGVELSDRDLADLTFYVEALAVPGGRDIDDPDVVAGAELFAGIGCASCHTPSFTTSQVEIRALSEQLVIPFTDLLLHDLGPGLDDGRPVFVATGPEWRTAPLWGVGLLDEVNGVVNLLHDGRARSIEEAILWHGGEALATIRRFMSLTLDQRHQLLRFVESR